MPVRWRDQTLAPRQIALSTVVDKCVGGERGGPGARPSKAKAFKRPNWPNLIFFYTFALPHSLQ